MKKIMVAFFVLLCAVPARAYENPFFSGYDNQIYLGLGQGVNNGFLIPPPFQLVPFYMIHLQYSQPATFFRLPARQSLNFIQTLGFGKKYGWHWNKYTIPIAVLSQDVTIAWWHRWYFAPGIGVGMQLQQNERLGAKLLFGFRLTMGYKITDCLGAEIFVQHYSNGNTSPRNYSYGFYGVGMTYSF